MSSEYIPNELLAYVFDSFDRDSSDHLEDVIMNFYGDGAVHDAKTLIWLKYKDQLPKFQDRRNNNAKRREVSDIMTAVKAIDQQFSDAEFLPFVFVAVKLTNLPNERYSAEMSIRNRLSLLESQMSEVLTSKLSYAATAVAGGVPPATNVHIKPNERNVQGQAIPRVDHKAKTPGLFNQHTGNKPVETERNHVTDAGQNEAPIGDDNSVQFRHLVGDREKYTTVTNRRRRQAAVYGNGTDDTFTAGLQKHDLFVFQVNKTVTDDQVKDYINKDDGVTVIDIKQMNSAEAPSNSYHVVVHCMDVRPILQPEFWPTGVGCRRFRKKQQWNNNGKQ